MGACRIQPRIGFLLVACLSRGLGQVAPSAAPSLENFFTPGVYESFFLEVRQLSRILTDGQANILTKPTIQEAIGLTDQEMRSLNALASDCLTEISPLRQAAPKLIFEARLRFVESGDSSAWLRQRLTDLDNQLNQAVSDHIQHLKVAFGDSRFQQLDAWVRSPESHHCFVSPCTGKKF